MKTKIISSLLSEVCDQNKHKIALKSGNASLNYSELDQLSDLIAACVYSEIGQSNIIATLLPPSFEYVLSILGINKSGNAFLPIEINLPTQKIADQLRFSSPEIIIGTKESLNLIEGISHESAVFQIELEKNELVVSKRTNDRWVIISDKKTVCEPLLDLQIDPKSNAYVLYTSGTTGLPKAIVGRNDSLRHFIEWQINEFGLTGIKSGLFTNLGFDVSLRDIFTPLLSGGELIIPTRMIKDDLFYVLDLIKNEQLELLHIVPSIFRILIHQDSTYFTSLKFIFSAGEALFQRDVQKWRAANGTNTELINLYGPSETTLAKLFYRIPISDKVNQESGDQVIPLGSALPDTEVLIYADNKSCGENEIGEILIRTQYPSNKYLNNRELSDEKFTRITVSGKSIEVYKTGDLGYIQENIVHFSGRQDRQIKIAGNRVELLEIEAALTRHEHIKTASVLLKTVNNEPFIVAFYSAENELENNHVKSYLEECLPVYMIPNFIHYIDEIPVTNNGKVNTRKLLELFNDKTIVASSEVNDYNDVKNRTVKIIQKYVSFAKIDGESTLMELGVSSLKSIQILSNLYKEFEVKIPLVFILYNKLNAVVKYIEDNLSEAIEEPTPEPITQGISFVSPNQKQMLFASLYSRESNLAYNVLLAYRINGKLEEGKIQSFANHLIEKYAIFRTTYFLKDNLFFQKVHPKQGDYSIFETATISEYEINHSIDLELNSEFDLFNESFPIKIQLLKIHDGDFVLIFKTHHITVDIQSLEIIKNEFFQYYTSGVLDIDHTDFEYQHFTEFYNTLLNSSKSEESKKFWNDKLKEKSNFGLPTDFKRSEGRGFAGENVSLNFDEALNTKLFDFVKENNTSVFMFYASTLSLFFKNYSQSDEVIFGMPMTLRDMGTTYNDTIGFFVNILPIKVVVGDDKLFLNYLQEKTSDLLDYYENKFYPFSQIVEDLNQKHELNKNPIFNYMVVGIESEEYIESDTEFSIEQLSSNDNTSKFDLTFMITTFENSVSLKIEYDVKLYERETVMFFLDQIKNSIQQVLENGNIKIDEIKFDTYDFAVPIENLSVFAENDALQEVNSVASIILPTNDTEEALFKIWKETLTDVEFGINQDFFEVGGTSMKAISLVTKINKAFEKKYTIVELFTNPTIEVFAKLMINESTENADVQLELRDEAIFTLNYSEITSEFDPTETPNILLTGATGFVGAYLVRDILSFTSDKIYCLVRCESEEAGREKIKESMQRKLIWNDDYENKIIVVKGDMAEPNLGIEEELYLGLAKTINLVIHNATFMNHAYAYEQVKQANVIGMEEILAFCIDQKMKKLHYVSTTSVFNSFTAKADATVDETMSFDNEKHYRSLGYKASKWVAEKLAKDASEKFGIPTVIHRPGLILWESKTKHYDGTNQWLKQYLDSCEILGVFPNYDDVMYQCVHIDVFINEVVSYLNGSFSTSSDEYFVLHHIEKRFSPKDLVIDYFGEKTDPLEMIDYTKWFEFAKAKELPISWRLSVFEQVEGDIIDLGSNKRIFANSITRDLINEAKKRLAIEQHNESLQRQQES